MVTHRNRILIEFNVEAPFKHHSVAAFDLVAGTSTPANMQPADNVVRSVLSLPLLRFVVTHIHWGSHPISFFMYLENRKPSAIMYIKLPRHSKQID